MTITPAQAPSVAPPLTETESKNITEATVDADKIVVAIHGIGDQYENATIQTVLSAFGRFACYPASMPLGFFHNTSSDKFRATQLKGPPQPGKPLDSMGFVEVYWANIPRKAQTSGYIIEETKAWARTVVERVRARFGASAGQLNGMGPDGKPLRLRLVQDDYLAGADAIEEMVDTFKVLDNLLFVAEKAGLVKFDLNYLLTRYVGDVQLVADFANYRNDILNNFRTVLNAVNETNTTADIYLVAHSEGTVVAFMGLLEAMSGIVRTTSGEKRQAPPDWVKQVRGLMTFGSPIDKHLVLWPNIWDPLQEPHPELPTILSNGPTAKIHWRNYYDYGDPVGFKLDTTRDWMAVHNWNQFFDFTDKHDYGFGRYLLPGTAHNDYWRDDAVFGHFIQTVMELPVPDGARSFDQPPGDKKLHRFGATIIPYLLVLSILAFGVYLCSKEMIEYMTPKEGIKPGYLDGNVRTLIKNVIGVTALLAGIIALARIPRLTRAPKLLIPAILSFGVGAALHALLVSPDVVNFHTLHQFQDGHAVNGFIFNLFGPGARGALHSRGVTSGKVSAAFIILLAGSVAGFAAWGSRRRLGEWRTGFLGTIRPFFVRTRPLILPSAAFVSVVIVYCIRNGGGQPLWPLVLASAAFIYLWWLAILIFDLVFVWHRYIRFSVAHNYLFALRKENKSRRKAQETAVTTTDPT